MFLKRDKPPNRLLYSNEFEEKGKEKEKEQGEEKIAMVARLVFTIATLEIVFS